MYGPTVRKRPARARAQAALSVELEYTLRIAGEERGFGRIPEMESVETGDAFARRPERVVRSEQDAVACIAAHVIDQIFGIAADLVRRRIDEDILILHDEREHLA